MHSSDSEFRDNLSNSAKMIKTLLILFLLVSHVEDSHGFTSPSISLNLKVSSLTRSSPLHYKNGTAAFLEDSSDAVEDPQLRFERVAAMTKSVDEPCMLIIDGKKYDMKAWAMNCEKA